MKFICFQEEKKTTHTTYIHIHRLAIETHCFVFKASQQNVITYFFWLVYCLGCCVAFWPIYVHTLSVCVCVVVRLASRTMHYCHCFEPKYSFMLWLYTLTYKTYTHELWVDLKGTNFLSTHIYAMHICHLFLWCNSWAKTNWHCHTMWTNRVESCSSMKCFQFNVWLKSMKSIEQRRDESACVFVVRKQYLTIRTLFFWHEPNQCKSIQLKWHFW